MNEKDRSLKSQLLISSRIKSNEDKFTGKLAWQQNGFFGYKKGDFNYCKKNFQKIFLSI